MESTVDRIRPGEEVLEVGESCFVLCETDDSGILVDADDFYRAVYDVAPRATRYLAFAGWQFDTHVPLVEGSAVRNGIPRRFLELLQALLARNEDLHVYILAWDFHPIYLFEREWFQKYRFTRSVSDRLHFELDGVHPLGASHHQKLILVDGTLAYLGGMDVCDHRWDDREHRPDNPRRVTIDGRRYGPYHDVQAYVTGDAAGALVELFEERWELATGESLRLPSVGVRHVSPSTIELGRARVALSETRGAMADRDAPARDHIGVKYARAIASAKRLIYIENQYFTAQRVFQALLDRICDREGPPLSIVLVLPREPSALKEALALGIRQCKLLEKLVRAAESSPHRLGIYYSSPTGRSEDATYIHSKILIVDDTLLSVGSANTTNRSLALDSELDATWCGEELEEKIRGVRASLWCEHAGVSRIEASAAQAFDTLERLCDDPGSRLHRLPFDDYGPLEGIVDDDSIPDVALDPETPIVIDAIQSLELEEKRRLWLRGLRWLRSRLSGTRRS